VRMGSRGVVGVVGATGPAGMGLAARLADAGYDVIAGSRSQERADAAVAELRGTWGDRVASISPATNEVAAAEAAMVVLATQWEGLVDTATALRESLVGKVVVSMGNALVKQGRQFAAIIPEGGSLAVRVASVAPGARVVAAFQHLPARELGDLSTPMHGDVLVCGDDPEAVETVCEMTTWMPELRPVVSGPLVNACGIEALTAVLLTVNLRHKVHSMLEIVGIP
jgi:8-hydroxy-5-deazaflavin:NADPH oxidoreductase